MLGSVKTLWKVTFGVGAALMAGSVGGALYDNHQAKKNVSLLDDDDFDDIPDDEIEDDNVEG